MLLNIPFQRDNKIIVLLLNLLKCIFLVRRDSSTYEDYNDEARHPRNFKRKRHEYRAKRWEDTEEHNRHGLNRSPNRQSIAASRRSFKSMTNFRKFDDQPRKQVRHTISSKSEVPSYRSKGNLVSYILLVNDIFRVTN